MTRSEARALIDAVQRLQAESQVPVDYVWTGRGDDEERWQNAYS